LSLRLGFIENKVCEEKCLAQTACLETQTLLNNFVQRINGIEKQLDHFEECSVKLNQNNIAPTHQNKNLIDGDKILTINDVIEEDTIIDDVIEEDTIIDDVISGDTELVVLNEDIVVDIVN